MKKFLMLFVVSVHAGLSGCSTYSVEQCQKMDWQKRGYEVAARGESVSQGVRYFSRECKGVPMDPEKFKLGYEAGLKTFCTSENIRAFAASGGIYQGQCPSDEGKVKFQESLQVGRQEYMVERMQDLERSVKKMEKTIEDQEGEIFRLKRTIRDQEDKIKKMKTHP